MGDNGSNGLGHISVGHALVNSLVGAQGIVVEDIAFEDETQLFFRYDDEPIQGFPTDRAHEALGVA
jgi:hypothetical protein